MDDEKIRCILAVSSTLKQVLQALLRTPAIADGDRVVVGDDGAAVTLSETAEFLDLIATIVEEAGDDVEQIHSLLFALDAALLPTVIALVALPTPTGPSSIQSVTAAALQCLTQIVSSACVDAYRSPARRRDGADVPQPPITSSAAKKVSETCASIVVRCGVVKTIIDLLNPALPPGLIKVNAAKLLFAIILRIPNARGQVTRPPHNLACLMDVASHDRNSNIRSYCLATVREVAADFALEVVSDDDAVESLVALLADSQPELRGLAAETIELLFRQEPQRWQQTAQRHNLAVAIASRLTIERADETLIPLLKLLETLLIADAALSLGKTTAPPEDSTATTESSFTETFINLRGEETLIQAIEAAREPDALCARCVRLLVEFAPYYVGISFGIAQNYSQFAQLLNVTATLANDVSNITSVADMRFELSLLIAMMLCQDPRVRQTVERELRNNNMVMTKLRGALLTNLNHAALGDYSGIRVVDVLGNNLSAPSKVSWDPSGQYPDRESLENLLDAQEVEFSEFAASGFNPQVLSNRGHGFLREVPASDPRGEAKETRLTFILLTSTVHSTFNVNKRANPKRPDLLRGAANGGQVGALLDALGGRPPHRASPSPEVSAVDRMLAHPSTILEARQSEEPFRRSAGDEADGPLPSPPRAPYLSGSQPQPTRTSLIREWRNHPQKLAAIKRMAKLAQQDGSTQAVGSQARPADYAVGGRQGPVDPTSQYRNNFVDAYVDPFRQPTQASFKKARSHSALQSSRSAPPPAAHTKLNAALKLSSDLGEHYAEADLHATAAKGKTDNSKIIFESAGDGFAQRQSQKSTNVSRQNNLKGNKTWCVGDLREGDLFFFMLPFPSVSLFSVDQIRLRAVRHLNQLKKTYVVVPHNMKGRRWFIFDMTTHVLPRAIAAMDDLLELMEVHGENNVRFALNLFKDGKLSGGADVVTDGNFNPGGSIHSGNLVECLEQVQFYLQKMGEMNPVAAAASATMVGPTSPAAAKSSQYLVDLEEKINSLKGRQFQPRIDAKFSTVYGGPGAAAQLPASPRRENRGPEDHPHDDDDLELEAMHQRSAGQQSRADDVVEQVEPRATIQRAVSESLLRAY